MIDPEQLTREQLLELVAAQQSRIDELLGLVAAQAQQIALQAAQIEQQNTKLTEQAERITELERQLGRNSKNSSQPPSQDPPSAPNRAARRAGGRKPGRQPGAAGTSLEQVSDPDVIIDHEPVACADCGTEFDTDTSRVAGFVARQVHDLPQPVTVEVIEHRLHRRLCGARGCSRVTTATAPAGVSAPVQYGPRVAAMVAYLLVVQHLPYERAVGLIEQMCPGLSPSTAWAVATVHRLAAAGQPVIEDIRHRLHDPDVTPVLHVDETSLNVAGAKQWLHVASSATLTSFHLDPSRGRPAVAAHNVLPRYTGTIVHDALSVYDDHKSYPKASHVLCGAHVLRELQAAVEANPGQDWPVAAIDALTALLTLTHTARAAGHTGPGALEVADAATAQCAARLRRDFQHAVLCGLATHPARAGKKQTKTRNLLCRLRERQPQYLAFSHDLDVPFTNNQAERDLRPAKTQMKISGCHRSARTATAWTTLRSLTSTWRKNTRHILTELQALLAGTAWTPAT